MGLQERIELSFVPPGVFDLIVYNECGVLPDPVAYGSNHSSHGNGVYDVNGYLILVSIAQFLDPIA